MTLPQFLRGTVEKRPVLTSLLFAGAIATYCAPDPSSKQEANTSGSSILFAPTRSLESSAEADSIAIARARARTDFVPDSSVENLSEAIPGLYYGVRIRVFPDGNKLRDFEQCLYEGDELEAVTLSSTLTDKENFRIFSSDILLYVGTNISPSMNSKCRDIRVRALGSVPVSPHVPLFKIG